MLSLESRRDTNERIAPYEYDYNDPINNIDPSGLLPDDGDQLAELPGYRSKSQVWSEAEAVIRAKHNVPRGAPGNTVIKHHALWSNTTFEDLIKEEANAKAQWYKDNGNIRVEDDEEYARDLKAYRNRGPRYWVADNRSADEIQQAEFRQETQRLADEGKIIPTGAQANQILRENNGSLLGALWDVTKTVAPQIAAAYGARGGTNITGRINMANTAEAEGAESESNQLLRLPNGDIRFRGMVVQVQEDLTHLTIQELDDMVETGASPLTEDGKVVTLHHVGQNPSGPLWEIAAPLNDVHNKELHPFGNAPGAGLTPAQRADFNNWRNEYWQSRASEELARRRLEQTGGQQ